MPDVLSENGEGIEILYSEGAIFGMDDDVIVVNDARPVFMRGLLECIRRLTPT